MYRNILVPVAVDHIDHASDSLKVAHCLLQDGGQITLLHVIEDIPSFVQTYLPEGTVEKNEADAAHRLHALASNQKQALKSAIVHGKPGVAILEYAEKHQSDCIIIASHKPGLEDYLIGSTAGRVVRHAKCGVHVLR